MSFESDFLPLMVSSITVTPLSSRDQYGAPQFSTPLTGIPAHVSYRTKAVRTSTEDKVLSTATIQIPPVNYLAGTVTVPRINEGDEVTLPDDNIVRHVLVAAICTDDTGEHHQEIMLT